MTLKEYLDEHELSLGAFGAQVGTSKQAVSCWVRGISRPSPRFMLRIMLATRYRVQPNDFYEDVA